MATPERIVAPTRFIQLSTDTKPAEGSGIQVPPGATTLEYDTGDLYISHDYGVTWSLKKSDGRIKHITGSSSAISTGAYSANEMINESTAGTGAMTTFAAVARGNGQGGYITEARISLGTTLLTPRITAYIFNTGTLLGGTMRDGIDNDNVQAADQGIYQGKIDFAALETLGTGGVSESIATPSTVGNLPISFECASDADDLYALLVTRDGVTAGTDLTTRIDLTVEQF